MFLKFPLLRVFLLFSSFLSKQKVHLQKVAVLSKPVRPKTTYNNYGVLCTSLQ